MHRLRVIGSTIAIVAIAGCGSTVPAATTAPAATTTPSAVPSLSIATDPSRTPTQRETPLVVPTAAPSSTAAGRAERFDYDELLEVTGEGLAVRRAPTTSAGLVFAAYWDPEGQEWVGSTDEVRLNSGHQVRVSLGPIEREGTTWYRVYEVQQPDDESVGVAWDADNDDQYAVPYGDHGWIAAANGDERFVQRGTNPEPSVMNEPLQFMAGGAGEFVSDPFTAAFPGVVGEWALATGDLAPCDLTITLEPSGEVLVSTSLIGAFESSEIRRDELEGEFRVHVTAGVPGHPDAECSWALHLGQMIG